jgi:hypothetical protein
MAPESPRQIGLAGLAVILAFVVYRVWSSTSAAPAQSSNGTTTDAGSGTASTSRRPAGVGAPDVHLSALSLVRPKPGESDRNLFRFNSPRPRPPVTPPASASTGPRNPVTGPVTPAGPPAITLKFVGLVERREQSERIAVLRDTIGHIFYGAEGAVIEGRYRILRIGAESIEMSYLDGQGRQTIRMSGG